MHCGAKQRTQPQGSNSELPAVATALPACYAMPSPPAQPHNQQAADTPCKVADTPLIASTGTIMTVGAPVNSKPQVADLPPPAAGTSATGKAVQPPLAGFKADAAKFKLSKYAQNLSPCTTPVTYTVL